MNVDFVCSSCNTPNTVDSTDYEKDCDDTECKMGVRTECDTYIEYLCECGNEIEITIHETEYPEGNFEEPEITDKSGVSVVSIS